MIDYQTMVRDFEQAYAKHHELRQEAEQIIDRIVVDLSHAFGRGQQEFEIRGGWPQGGPEDAVLFTIEIDLSANCKLPLRCALEVCPDEDVRAQIWRLVVMSENFEVNDYGEAATESVKCDVDPKAKNPLSPDGLDRLTHHIQYEIRYLIQRTFPLVTSYQQVMRECTTNVRS